MENRDAPVLSLDPDWVARTVDFLCVERLSHKSLERLLHLAQRAVAFEYTTGIYPDLGDEIPTVIGNRNGRRPHGE